VLQVERTVNGKGKFGVEGGLNHDKSPSHRIPFLLVLSSMTVLFRSAEYLAAIIIGVPHSCPTYRMSVSSSSTTYAANHSDMSSDPLFSAMLSHPLVNRVQNEGGFHVEVLKIFWAESRQ